MQDMTYVGELELPYILDDYKWWGKIVTAFDIAPDGSRFLVLTYADAVEFDVDLSVGPVTPVRDMVPGVDFSIVSLKLLPQQEAVAYLPDGRSFIYDTEAYEEEKVPIMRVRCR